MLQCLRARSLCYRPTEHFKHIILHILQHILLRIFCDKHWHIPDSLPSSMEDIFHTYYSAYYYIYFVTNTGMSQTYCPLAWRIYFTVLWEQAMQLLGLDVSCVLRLPVPPAFIATSVSGRLSLSPQAVKPSPSAVLVWILGLSNACSHYVMNTQTRTPVRIVF